MDWECLLKDMFGTLFAVKITLFPMQVNMMQTFQRQRNPNVDILYITESKVEENKHFLEDRFANVRSYSGYSQMHCFKYYGNNIIHMSETSDCTRFTVAKVFIDPHFATESESNPKQEESSCAAEN